MNVIMVDDRAVAVGRHAELAAARVEERQLAGRKVLPLAVQGRAVAHGPDPRRMAAHLLVQAREALVEMVLLRVPAALVEQAHVVAVLVARQLDAALEGHHRLRGGRVDTSIHVALAGATAQTRQDVGLLRAEARFKRAVDVLARGDAPRVCRDAGDGRVADVSEQRRGADTVYRASDRVGHSAHKVPPPPPRRPHHRRREQSGNIASGAGSDISYIAAGSIAAAGGSIAGCILVSAAHATQRQHAKKERVVVTAERGPHGGDQDALFW